MVYHVKIDIWFPPEKNRLQLYNRIYFEENMDQDSFHSSKWTLIFQHKSIDILIFWRERCLQKIRQWQGHCQNVPLKSCYMIYTNICTEMLVTGYILIPWLIAYPRYFHITGLPLLSFVWTLPQELVFRIVVSNRVLCQTPLPWRHTRISRGSQFVSSSEHAKRRQVTVAWIPYFWH